VWKSNHRFGDVFKVKSARREERESKSRTDQVRKGEILGEAYSEPRKG